MHLKKLLIIGLFAFPGLQSVYAQQDTMYFVKQGILVNKQAISASEVDSIILYNPGNVMSAITDTLYFIKNGIVINKQAINSAIDSLIFYPPPELNSSVSVLIDNNSVWKDENGLEIKAQGGCILKDGLTFHWIGPQFEPGYRFIAVNHYISTDLKNWIKLTPLLTPLSPGMADISVNSSTWVGRPCVLKRAENDYVMWVELGKLSTSSFRNRYAVFESVNIGGPWTFVRQYESLPDRTGTQRGLGDLSAYHDASTGNAYILYTFDRDQTNGFQSITKLSDDFRSIESIVAEFRKTQGSCYEAAAIFKRGATYYYIMSETRGWQPSDTWYRTSDTLGPETGWSTISMAKRDPYPGTRSYFTQHDFVLPLQGTDGTTFIFCGDRWSVYAGNDYGNQAGRQAWFPLKFDDHGIITICGPDFEENGGDWILNVDKGTWSKP